MNDAHPVHPALKGAMDARGFTVLTDVQTEVSAPDYVDKDLLVSARTGSGKTVAFGLALAKSLLDDGSNAPLIGPHAIVIAPTRELALQVQKELSWLYADTGLIIGSSVGGMDPRAERRALERGIHILVGTPGRLVDHLTRHPLDLADIRAVVLDEADEMLDLGFREDLETLLNAMPQSRRTLMFSATVSKPIVTLAKQYQQSAIRVEAGSADEPHKDITYSGFTITPSDREKAIINVLRFHDDARAIIFCATRANVAYMSARFANRGFQVVSLSGELNQAARNQALQSMRDGRAKICVATDVAARGIDLPDLDLVIHADIPKTAETLLHRSGRTGRAGRKGHSILIVPHNSFRKTQRLLQVAGVEAKFGPAPDADTIRSRDDERILTHISLSETVQDDEKALVNSLVETYTPAQIATAFIRSHRAAYSAPEELSKIGTSQRDEEPMDVQWISLSTGRKDDVQLRFILAMLTRHGDLLRKDIGHIRLHHAESHVAVAKTAMDGFLQAIGPELRLGSDLTVAVLDGPPPAARASRDKNRPKKFARDRNEGSRKGRDRDESPRRYRDKTRTGEARAKKWSPENQSDEGGITEKPFRKRSGLPRTSSKSAGKQSEKASGKSFDHSNQNKVDESFKSLRSHGKERNDERALSPAGREYKGTGRKHKGKKSSQGGGGRLRRRVQHTK